MHQATAIWTAPNNYGVEKKTQVNVKNTVVDPYVHASIFGVLLRTNSKRGGKKLRKKLGSKIEVTAEPWDLTAIKQHWLLLYCKQTQKS